MAVPTIQTQLNAGEISPSIYGRVDFAKYRQGCSTLRNMWASYRGGASSRAGTKFVGLSRQSGDDPYPPQLIPFSYSINQGYVLVFSNLEMCVVANGAFVTEDPFTITNVTQASIGVVTAAGNTFTTTDWVYITGVGGMTQLNGNTYAINSIPTTGSFTLKSALTGAVIDTTTYSAYTTGGTVARIFTLATPYVSADLQSLKWAQSADVLTITHPSYPPADITRIAANNWTYTTTSFTASIVPPATATATPSTTTASEPTQYAYVVTAIDALTGEESVASPIATVTNSVNIAQTLGSENVSWSAVTGATQYNIYKAPPSFTYAVPVGSLFGYAGTSFGLSWVDSNIVQDMSVTPPLHTNPFAAGAIDYFTITNTGSGYTTSSPPTVVISDATGYGATGQAVVVGSGVQAIVLTDGGANYTNPTVNIRSTGTGSGAIMTALANGHGLWDGGSSPSNVQINNGGTGYTTPAVIASWIKSGNTVSFAATSVTVGGGGAITAVTFPATAAGQQPVYTSVSIAIYGSSGTGAAATAHVAATTGTYPSCVAYFQQRRFYANTNNDPDTYWASQPGAFTNFDTSVPIIASDAITGTPWSQQVNGIQAMVPMPGGLVVLTGLGAWQLSGGAPGTAISPTQQVATPQAYNGCHDHVRPIPVNYDILYVQQKGSIVRDLNYNFFSSIYTGADLTVLSNHLFTGYDLERWDWAEEPYKLVWAVRSDGDLLSMTYLKTPTVYGGQADTDIYSWARHDTNGQFKSVAVVTEPPVDAPYFVVKRQIRTT